MAQKLCTACGYIGQSKRETKGSFIMEVFLWLIFLVPGFLYSIWRLTTRYDACPKCSAANMIPANSPVAKRMLQEQQPAPQPQRTAPAQKQIPPPPQPQQPVEKRLRIAKDGRDLGEHSITAVQQMLDAGQLTARDYYFDHTANNWLEIALLANDRNA